MDVVQFLNKGQSHRFYSIKTLVLNIREAVILINKIKQKSLSTNCTLVSVGCTCYEILKLQPLYLLFWGSSISTFSFQCKQNTFGMFSFAKLDTIPSQHICFLPSKTLNTFQTFAPGILDLFLSQRIRHKIFLFEHSFQRPSLSSKKKLTHTAKNVE